MMYSNVVDLFSKLSERLASDNPALRHKTLNQYDRITTGYSANTKPSRVDRNIEYDKIVEEVSTIKTLIEELKSTLEQISAGGGGNGMDDLRKRVENLEKDILIIKEQTKKLEIIPSASEIQLMLSQTITEATKFIPSEDRVKTLIREINKSDNLSTEDFVEKKINKSKLQLILWIVGTGIAITATIVSTIVRLIS